MRRVIVGFCIAPLATPLAIWMLFSVAYLLGVDWFDGGDYRATLGTVWFFALFATMIALATTIIGAIPAFVFLRRRKLLRLRHFVILGILLGLLPFVGDFSWGAIQELSRSFSSGWDEPILGTKATLARLISNIPVVIIWMLLGAYCGMVSAAVFWLVAVRRNRAVHETSSGP